MKPFGIVLLSVVVISFLILPAFPQLPYLAVYFDSQLTRPYAEQCPDDPPGSVLDTMYAVAVDLNAYISAIEYRMDYPPEMIFLSDQTGGLDIGNSALGIATAWPFPQNAYTPLVVSKVHFLWNCQGCPTECINTCICPQGHPASGSIRAVRWPDNQYLYMTLQPGMICPTA